MKKNLKTVACVVIVKASDNKFYQVYVTSEQANFILDYLSPIKAYPKEIPLEEKQRKEE